MLTPKLFNNQDSNGPIFRLDVNTGEVTRYETIGGCAKDLQIDTERVLNYLERRGAKKALLRRYHLKFENDPWPHDPFKPSTDYKFSRHNDVCVFDMLNNKLYVFESVRHAANFIRIRASRLHSRLKSIKDKDGQTWYIEGNQGIYAYQYLKKLVSTFDSKKDILNNQK